MHADHIYSDNRLVIYRTDLPGVLSMFGEVDQFNADAVATALDAELRAAGAGVANPRPGSRSGGQLRVDVSRLEFVDTGGIRALVKIAGCASDRLPLVLTGLPPLLRKVMFAVGWGDLPGLVIAESESELHDSSAV
jgi:ABC-type transporter Mla MlaB component